MTQIFFQPSLLLMFWIWDLGSEIWDPGSEIRDPGWVKNQDLGSRIRYKHPRIRNTVQKYPVPTVPYGIITWA
jgi:hypothetical protein